MEFHRYMKEMDPNDINNFDPDEAQVSESGEEMMAASSYVAQFAANYTMQTLFGMDMMDSTDAGANIEMTEEEIELEYQAYLKKYDDAGSARSTDKETNKCQVKNITQLPAEILLHILSFLSWKSKITLYNTNRLMRCVATDSSLWTEVDCQKVSSSKDNVTMLKGVMDNILQSDRTGLKLKRLHLGLLHIYLRENVLSDLLPFTPNLQHLCITAAIKVTAEEIQSIIQFCKNLLVLELPDCRVLDDTIISQFKGLKRIDFSAIQGYNSITDAGVCNLLKNCKNLDWINLSGCHALTDAFLIALEESEIRGLEHVSLIGCFEITSRGLNELLRTQNCLSYLDVSFCWQVDDSIFRNLDQQSCITNSMETMLLQGCSQLTHNCLQALVDLSPKHLKSLNVSYCTGLTDRAVPFIKQLQDIGSSKPKIVCEECVNLKI